MSRITLVDKLLRYPHDYEMIQLRLYARKPYDAYDTRLTRRIAAAWAVLTNRAMAVQYAQDQFGVQGRPEEGTFILVPSTSGSDLEPVKIVSQESHSPDRLTTPAMPNPVIIADGPTA